MTLLDNVEHIAGNSLTFRDAKAIAERLHTGVGEVAFVLNSEVGDVPVDFYFETFEHLNIPMEDGLLHGMPKEQKRTRCSIELALAVIDACDKLAVVERAMMDVLQVEPDVDKTMGMLGGMHSIISGVVEDLEAALKVGTQDYSG